MPAGRSSLRTIDRDGLRHTNEPHASAARSQRARSASDGTRQRARSASDGMCQRARSASDGTCQRARSASDGMVERQRRTLVSPASPTRSRSGLVTRLLALGARHPLARARGFYAPLFFGQCRTSMAQLNCRTSLHRTRAAMRITRMSPRLPRRLVARRLRRSPMMSRRLAT